MLTLIRNATVITGDIARNVLYDGCVAVDGTSIVAVGPSSEVTGQYPDAQIVDGRGKAVFPGLVNAHTHLLATTDRGILEDFGFPTTLRFPESARSLLTPDERNIMALLGAVEAIRSGTTCLLEISNDIPQYAESLEGTGLRLALAENVNDIDDAVAQRGAFAYSARKLDAGLLRSVDLIEGWHGRADGRVQCLVAPHAPENCSPELLRGCRELAERYGTRYTIHLAQSHYEVEAVMRTRGVRPTQYLFANGLLGPDLIAAHCRYVDASEIALLGQTGTGVSNNAAIAARRGAAAPIKELEAAGCPIGVGTDNMAEDMVEAMRAGLFLERVRRNDEMDPQPEDVLEWGTRGGARLLGMEQEIGSLEAGKKADLFIIQTMRPHLVPSLRIVSAFIHNGQPADITDVMVDGQWLMREGKLQTVDEDDIVSRAERIGHAAWKRLVERYPEVPLPVNLPPTPAS